MFCRQTIFLVSLLFLILAISPSYILAFTEPVKSNSGYTLPAGRAPANGVDEETIKIQLKDVNGNNIVGDLIIASSLNDPQANFPRNNQITDLNGEATFTLTTTTPGDVKITIYDSTSNTTFSDWFNVNFYDPSAGCSNPPSTPILNKIVLNPDRTVTLNWQKSSDPVSNYLVSYGLSSKNYIYGSPNMGPQGTITYTVGNLTNGKKYFFAVGATNDCGRSDLSNELSMLIGAVPQKTTIPSPTPSQVFLISPVPKIQTLLPKALPQLIEKKSPINGRWGAVAVSLLGLSVLFGVIIFRSRH